MTARARPAWRSSGYLAGVSLTVASTVACGTSGRADDPSATLEAVVAHDVTTSSADAMAVPAGSMTTQPGDDGRPGRDARPPARRDEMTASSGSHLAWRKAIDDVLSRFDRGQSPARALQVLGRVSNDGDRRLRIEPTPPWIAAAEARMDAQVVYVRITMAPLLARAELEAEAGPCRVGQQVGGWGEGVWLYCRAFENRRGTLEISATTDPTAGGADNSMVDMLVLEWRPLPAGGKQR